MSRGRVGASAAAGLLAAAVAFLIGVGPAHATLAGLAVLVLGSTTAELGSDPQLPGLPGPERSGYRREVADLSWMLTSRSGRIGPGFHRRLREVARTRLALHGLDLDDPTQAPALHDRLGAEAAATLAPSPDPLPTETDVARCLDALDRLGAGPTERML